jgi:hypothetical protein
VIVVPYEPQATEPTAGEPVDKDLTPAAEPTTTLDDNALSKVVLRTSPTLFLWLFR